MGAHAHKYPSKARIELSVAAARAAGIDVGGVEVSPNGQIRIIDAKALPGRPMNDFDRWEQDL